MASQYSPFLFLRYRKAIREVLSQIPFSEHFNTTRDLIPKFYAKARQGVLCNSDFLLIRLIEKRSRIFKSMNYHH